MHSNRSETREKGSHPSAKEKLQTDVITVQRVGLCSIPPYQSLSLTESHFLTCTIRISVLFASDLQSVDTQRLAKMEEVFSGRVRLASQEIMKILRWHVKNVQ